jgi:UDP:flavonoid glycosyltransferase YjiC (YdhE family)
MRILLMSLGSRGDCEPFLGVGEILRERGDEVLCSFSEQHRDLAEEAGFPFYSLGTEYIAMMESDLGRQAMSAGKGGVRKVFTEKAITKKALLTESVPRRQQEVIQELQPDCILFYITATYPLVWHLNTGGKVILFSSVPRLIHETRGYPSTGVNKDLGSLNPLTYPLINFLLSWPFRQAVRKFARKRVSVWRIRRELQRMKFVYAVSPTLFPRLDYWPEHVMVGGFLRYERETDWQPTPELQEFIDSHGKLLFVTFGSMLTSDPVGKTAILLQALGDCGIPAIINTSSGGLVEPADYDRSLVRFTQAVPYDRIFPQMYAVVHHGGAGTTQSALKAGCATMAIPHVVDQPMWNGVIDEAGVGPRGLPIAEFEVEALSAKLRDLFDNGAYRERAQKIARQMQAEDLSDELYRFITT